MTLQPIDTPKTKEEAKMNALSSLYTSLVPDILPVKEDESTHISLKDKYDPDDYNWCGIAIWCTMWP